MADTVNEGWPLIAAAQAQKHVTHNEALVAIDTRISTWMQVNWTYPVVTAGVLTVTSSAVSPTLASGVTGNVTSIVGGKDGTMLIIGGVSGVTLTFVDGGNMKLGAARVLNNFDDTLTLVKRGTDWLEVAFSNNG